MSPYEQWWNPIPDEVKHEILEKAKGIAGIHGNAKPDSKYGKLRLMAAEKLAAAIDKAESENLDLTISVNFVAMPTEPEAVAKCAVNAETAANDAVADAMIDAHAAESPGVPAMVNVEEVVS